MAVLVGSRESVSSLVRQPLPYGLLSVAGDVTEDDGHWQISGFQAEGDLCLTANYAVDPCDANHADAKIVQDGYPLYTGDTFTVYTLNRCRLPGGRFTVAEAATRKGLEDSEGVAVEASFVTKVLQPNATDITPTGGPVPLKVGVGMLEGYAAQHYGGLPTIHIARSLASLLGGVSKDTSTDTLRTLLNSPVAAGGGYEGMLGPAGAAAGAGNAWLYATGAVLLKKGPIHTYPVPDVRQNEFSVLAERTWGGAVDCFVAAIKVKTPTAAG